ncbi:MAG TPA: dienelactone hydrolase family protein [Steroidobacteraceae bacterium]
MCDNDSYDDILKHESTAGRLSRRRFGALGLGAGLISMLPPVVNAAAVTETEVDIATPDGVANAYFVHPSHGVHPGVLIWPDVFGLRPFFRQLGRHLAESGYSVLVVNPFYRIKREPLTPDFDNPVTRTTMTERLSSLTPRVMEADAKAFIPYLDAQRAVDKKRKLGTAGYCIGGPLTFRTAAAFPDRIGAGASFHGNNLVTNDEDSPHLLIPKMQARYLVGIAENDDARTPDAKNVLRDSFQKAHREAEVEVYAGAQHGWCTADVRTYNQEAAEKAWGRLLVLFKAGLV